MKERPIPFCGEMVRAILDGRKTETRRVMKPQPAADAEETFFWWYGQLPQGQCAKDGIYTRSARGLVYLSYPKYGVPGDRLWVRETWYDSHIDGINDGLWYKATAPGNMVCHWRPSRFMPHWASRITLEITGVRVERLQDMGENDAIAEGVTPEPGEHYLSAFVRLWDSINAKKGYGFESNPLGVGYRIQTGELMPPTPLLWPCLSIN